MNKKELDDLMKSDPIFRRLAEGLARHSTEDLVKARNAIAAHEDLESGLSALEEAFKKPDPQKSEDQA